MTTEELVFLLSAARACWQNAAELADEATLLFRNGSYARALALAVVSIEEDGKAGEFVGQTMRDDPTFLETLEKRSHPTKQHHIKQQGALDSIRAVYGNLPPFADGTPRPTPIDDINLGGASEQIHPAREASLYVDFAGGKILVPRERVDEAAARTYVTLALAAKRKARWNLGTPEDIVVEYYQTYRAAVGSLAQVNDLITKGSPAEQQRFLDQVNQAIYSRFQYLRDEGELVAIERVPEAR